MGSNVAKKATLAAMLDADESPAAASQEVPIGAPQLRLPVKKSRLATSHPHGEPLHYEYMDTAIQNLVQAFPNSSHGGALY